MLVLPSASLDTGMAFSRDVPLVVLVMTVRSRFKRAPVSKSTIATSYPSGTINANLAQACKAHLKCSQMKIV